MALNNWVATGRLTQQAELRYTANGLGICNFTLAVQRNYKDKDDNRPADFIQCVLFGSEDQEKCRATKLVNYLNQGTLVNVEARLQSRSYENSEGFKVYVTEAVIEEIYLLAQPQDKQEQPQQNSRNQGSNRNNNRNNTTNNRNNNRKNNGNTNRKNNQDENLPF